MSKVRIRFVWQSLAVLLALCSVLFFILFIETESAVSSPTVTFIVDTANDASDPTPDCTCSTTAGCTLRAAIQSANACAGGQTIQFYGPWQINVASQLPTLTDDGTIIDASNHWFFGGGIPYPGVEINGSGLINNGLAITASHCAVYGLQILNFTNNGVLLSDGASFNYIGGSGFQQRNIISNNAGNGVRIENASSSGNYIWFNYIGTNPEGTNKVFPPYASWGNKKHGVSVNDAEANVVSYNLISGNAWSAVAFDFVNSNPVEHNQIGFDIFGNRLGNGYYGIHVANGSDPLIQENSIRFNQRGIYVDGGSNPRIIDNTIYSNTASLLSPADGGGILVTGSGTTADIEENYIHGNTALKGGGIAIEADAYGWIYDNLIQNNQVTETVVGAILEIDGGGIFVSESGAWIRENDILSNTAINDFSSPAYGGGISLWQADLVDIIENELRGNSTQGDGDRGGGIYIFQSGLTKIQRNSITENHSNSGGCGIGINNLPTGSQTWIEGNRVVENQGGSSAIIIFGADYVTLTNNLIADNDFIGLFISSNGDHFQIIHNTIVGNEYSGLVINNTGMGLHNNISALNGHYGVEYLGSYSSSETRNDVWGNAWGATNLGGHPFYLEEDPQFFDSADGFYQIRSTSPCMDDCAYDHSSDTSFNGLSRPQGAGCDIGAYEMAQPLYFPVIIR